MKNIICLAIFAFLFHSGADASEFIKCVATTDAYKASVSINSNGTGLFSLLKTGSKEESACALKLNIFSDKRKAIVPMIRAELERSECMFAGDTKSTEVLNRIVLQLKIFDGEKSKTGIMQWTGKSQPDECEIEELDLESVEHYSARWMSGKWGRKPASLKGLKDGRKNRN